MAKHLSVYSYRVTRSLENRSWMYESDNLPDFNEMMDEVRRWSYENNKYRIHNSITHNLLLMGKTRTGKTTIARVLENPCYVPPNPKLYSETKEITIHPVATSIVNDRNIYCFNIIDTPGMFDKVKRQNKFLTNERIKLAIDKCLEEDVTNIHLFAFVISLQSNVDNEDIASMIFVKDNYPFLHDYICLIVTHCEETTWEQRHEKISEFLQSEKIMKHNLKDFFGKKIFFMGSLRPELTSFPNRQAVRQQIKNVHEMRDIFLDYVIRLDPNDCFNIHHVSSSHGCILL